MCVFHLLHRFSEARLRAAELLTRECLPGSGRMGEPALRRRACITLFRRLAADRRQGHFQQPDEPMRMEGAGSNYGRQEEYLPFCESIIRTGVLQLTAPAEAHHYTRHLRRTDDERQLPADSRDTELITSNELLP